MEGLKLVNEVPPQSLVDQAMKYFGVDESEAKEYLINERRKINEKHTANMEKILGAPESQN